MPERLKKYLLISLGGHVLIVFFMFISDMIKFPKDETPITYVTLSFGDGGTNTRANNKIEGMPAFTIRDQREALKQLAKLKEIPKEKTDKIPALDVKKGKETIVPPVDKKKVIIGGGKTPAVPDTSQMSATDRALARIQDRNKIRQEQIKQIPIGAAQSQDGESGQSLWGGESGTALDPALVQYYSIIRRKLTSAWLLSKSNFNPGLIAKIEVDIDAQGHVLSKSFKVTSGDGSFDDSAERAILKAQPFPEPPASIRNQVLGEGFIFTFKPGSVTASAAN